MSLLISPVASDVWLARLEISVATTAKPLPASPALAASMDALRARRDVWSATLLISSVIEFIWDVVCENVASAA